MSGGVGPTGRQPSAVRQLMQPLAIPASGLSAQRARMDVIAGNIANAETTRVEDGGPYRRQQVELAARPFGAELAGALWRGAPFAWAVPAPLPSEYGPAGTRIGGGVEVLGVVEDETEGPLVYEPGHPDADEAGYVRYPNVRLTDELVDLMDARRIYEANATVFQVAKAILRKSIEL